MRSRARTLATVLVALLGVGAAGATSAAARPARAPAAKAKVTITLVTHDSFAVSKSVLAAFTRTSGVTVKVLRSGDAGAALNQVILTKDHPLGDVLYGVDNTFLSRAIDNGIFEMYAPADLQLVPAALQLDPTGHAVPIDYGDVCVNTDLKWFAKHGLAPPASLEDLAKPAYRDLLVVENPATSSPGLAFLLATVARYGEDGWRDYWTRLRANGVEVVAGWEQAYDESFTQGGGKGDRPLVVSYASSPPAAVYYAKPHPKQSPVGTVLDGCFRQVEFAGVLAGTQHRRAARRLVDFLLSERFQGDMPLQMFVFPAREGTPLPAIFTKFADVPAAPLALAPGVIDKNRERWIEQWTETVLR